MLPVIGRYIQEVDCLDYLRAIGIARAFAYGASHPQPIYNPNIKPVTITSKKQYYRHQSTTINHFYEKSFHLSVRMNTSAGKEFAEQRTNYMKSFLTEFLQE